MSIDVYPVGWLSALRRAWAGVRRGNGSESRWYWFSSPLRQQLQFDLHRAREGNWRAVRQSLNGFLAEPQPWPTGLRRCGSGWTRKRALRSLARHARRAGVS